jgi:hypothetical protein
MTFPPYCKPRPGGHVFIFNHEAKNIAFSPDNFNSKMPPYLYAWRLSHGVSGNDGFIFFLLPFGYRMVHLGRGKKLTANCDSQAFAANTPSECTTGNQNHRAE